MFYNPSVFAPQSPPPLQGRLFDKHLYFRRELTVAIFTLKIAGCTVWVQAIFDSTKDYCRDYLTNATPSHSIRVTQEDLEAEQQYLNEEADREGLRRRVFGKPFLERNFLQRRIAQLLLSRQVLLIHGSAVAINGAGYLFTAPCGTGKSTHARLWREVLGASAVNDDKPFLRLTETGVLLCGSPWQGKHGIGENITVPLKGICLLQRGSRNVIVPLSPEEALPELIRQSSDPSLTRAIAGQVPLWLLTCTPDGQAAQIAYAAMSGCHPADN